MLKAIGPELYSDTPVQGTEIPINTPTSNSPIVFQLGGKGNNNNKTNQVESIEKVIEIDPEVMEVYWSDIDQKSASLPPSCRIKEIGDFVQLPGKVRTIMSSECGSDVQNALYGINHRDDRYQELSHPGHYLEK